MTWSRGSSERKNKSVRNLFLITLGFDEFLKIFSLKLTDYTFNDVRNAFKLLAKDDDRY
jgi:hypothetical protein